MNNAGTPDVALGHSRGDAAVRHSIEEVSPCAVGSFRLSLALDLLLLRRGLILRILNKHNCRFVDCVDDGVEGSVEGDVDRSLESVGDGVDGNSFLALLGNAIEQCRNRAWVTVARARDEVWRDRRCARVGERDCDEGSEEENQRSHD